MKVRVRVEVGGVRVDETLEGRDEEEIARKLRAELERRAPFAARLVLRTMDDRALWRKVVEMHNNRAGGAEPVPASAREFLAFAERAGYVTRLEG